MGRSRWRRGSGGGGGGPRRRGDDAFRRAGVAGAAAAGGARLPFVGGTPARLGQGIELYEKKNPNSMLVIKNVLGTPSKKKVEVLIFSSSSTATQVSWSPNFLIFPLVPLHPNFCDVKIEI